MRELKCAVVVALLLVSLCVWEDCLLSCSYNKDR